MPKPNTLKTTYHIWAVYGDSEARIFLTQEIESPANKHTQRKKKDLNKHLHFRERKSIRDYDYRK